MRPIYIRAPLRRKPYERRPWHNVWIIFDPSKSIIGFKHALHHSYPIFDFVPANLPIEQGSLAILVNCDGYKNTCDVASTGSILRVEGVETSENRPGIQDDHKMVVFDILKIPESGSEYKKIIAEIEPLLTFFESIAGKSEES